MTPARRLLGASAVLRSLRIERLQRWSSQGFWAILDQALFALSNLLINVLLARSLTQAEYGAFVTGYTALMFASVAHTSLLSEPMQIFGAQKYRDGFSHYLRVLCRYHWQLMGLMSAILAVLAVGLWVQGHPVIAQSMAGLALAGPFILLAWLARRACYPVLRPRWAATAGLANIVVIVGGTTMLASLDQLSVFSAQLLAGVAALCAATLMLVPLGRVTQAPMSAEMRATVWPTHWRYARWSGSGGVANWFAGYVYYLALPVWGGLAAAGGMRALTNLVMPVLQSDAALSTLLVPVLVGNRSRPDRFRRIVIGSVGAFAVEAIVYWLLLVLVGQQVLAWLYEGAYQFDVSVLMLLGLMPICAALLNVFGAALLARERPEALFWAMAASAVFAGTLGVAAVASYGVTGAVLGSVGGAATQAGVMLWFLIRSSAPATGGDIDAAMTRPAT